jgi:hypothetical protein
MECILAGRYTPSAPLIEDATRRVRESDYTMDPRKKGAPTIARATAQARMRITMMFSLSEPKVFVWRNFKQGPATQSDFPVGNHMREGGTLGFVKNVWLARLPRGHGVADPITWTPNEPNLYPPGDIVYVSPAGHFIIAERSAPFNSR